MTSLHKKCNSRKPKRLNLSKIHQLEASIPRIILQILVPGQNLDTILLDIEKAHGFPENSLFQYFIQETGISPRAVKRKLKQAKRQGQNLTYCFEQIRDSYAEQRVLASLKEIKTALTKGKTWRQFCTDYGWDPNQTHKYFPEVIQNINGKTFYIDSPEFLRTFLIFKSNKREIQQRVLSKENYHNIARSYGIGSVQFRQCYAYFFGYGIKAARGEEIPSVPEIIPDMSRVRRGRSNTARKIRKSPILDQSD